MSHRETLPSLRVRATYQYFEAPRRWNEAGVEANGFELYPKYSFKRAENERGKGWTDDAGGSDQLLGFGSN